MIRFKIRQMPFEQLQFVINCLCQSSSCGIALQKKLTSPKLGHLYLLQCLQKTFYTLYSLFNNMYQIFPFVNFNACSRFCALFFFLFSYTDTGSLIQCFAWEVEVARTHACKIWLIRLHIPYNPHRDGVLAGICLYMAVCISGM